MDRLGLGGRGTPGVASEGAQAGLKLGLGVRTACTAQMAGAVQRNWQSVPKEEKFSSESEHLGLISACTRQPLDHPGPRLRRRAYPRSHGATAHEKYVALLDGGLSPLARGNRACAHGVQAHQGPIPARTGQPSAPPAARSLAGAYPRSHGATTSPPLTTSPRPGLSPLARGNPAGRVG